MSRLKNKTVFITGATSGIGRACAFQFAAAGANLLLCARRKSILDETAEEIRKSSNVNIHTFELDVTSREAVGAAISSLPEEWKKVDILINNAGLARGFDKFYDCSEDDWDIMIDTNVKGLLYVTKAVIPEMLKKGQGHIINIGSIAGHEPYPKGAVYCATKHAVDAITKSLRMDLVDKNIRVSTIDPGMVETNFSVIRFHGDEEKAKNVYKGLTPLTADDIAETILFIASRPDHVNIGEVIIFPTAQASATISHRGV